MTGLETTPINIPFPDAPDLTLQISVNGCQLHLKSAQQADWIQGESTYKRPPGPSIEQHAGSVSIKQEYLRSELTNMFRVAGDSPQLRLNISPQQPFALALESIGDTSRLDLGGLPLTSFTLAHKIGSAEFDFSRPGGATMELFEVDVQAASVEIKNLANANFAHMKLRGSSASYTIDLGNNPLPHDASIHIEAVESPTTLHMPLATAVKVYAADGSELDTADHEFDANEGFIKHDGGYWTQAAIDDVTPVLTIRFARLGPIAVHTV